MPIRFNMLYLGLITGWLLVDFMPVYPLVVRFKSPSPSTFVVQEVPEFLSSHWDTMCVMYVDNIKAVMQHLRAQRTEIDLRFYDMRYSSYALEILWT